MYILLPDGDDWPLLATLVASDEAAGARLGYSVALSADGTLVAAGAPPVNTQGYADARNGSVHIFGEGSRVGVLPCVCAFQIVCMYEMYF